MLKIKKQVMGLRKEPLFYLALLFISFIYLALFSCILTFSDLFN